MSTNKKNTFKFTAGAIVLSLISSAIYDLIKSKPFLFTLQSIFKTIWYGLISFLTYDLKVWWIFIGIAIVLVILWFVRAGKNMQLQNSNPEWLHYTSDTFDSFRYKWRYNHLYDNMMEIVDIQAYCPIHNCLVSGQKCPVGNEWLPTHEIDKNRIRILIQHRIDNNLWKK